jgi:hypothetical protein
MPSTSAIFAGSGILGVIVITVRVRVRRGAVRAVPESLLQDLHDLEVGYFVRLQTSVYRYNITSIGPWAIRGCVANKYLLFAPNPNNHLRATSPPPDPLVSVAGDHHRAHDPTMEAALRRPLSIQEGGETSPLPMLRGLRPAAPSGGGEGRVEGRRRPGVVALRFPPWRSRGASRGRRFFS